MTKIADMQRSLETEAYLAFFFTVSFASHVWTSIQCRSHYTSSALLKTHIILKQLIVIQDVSKRERTA